MSSSKGFEGTSAVRIASFAQSTPFVIDYRATQQQHVVDTAIELAIPFAQLPICAVSILAGSAIACRGSLPNRPSTANYASFVPESFDSPAFNSD